MSQKVDLLKIFDLIGVPLGDPVGTMLEPLDAYEPPVMEFVDTFWGYGCENPLWVISGSILGVFSNTEKCVWTAQACTDCICTLSWESSL